MRRVALAVGTSDVEQTVTSVQHLILRYYATVREQAIEGFVLLLLTLRVRDFH